MSEPPRDSVIRRGIRLGYVTIGYNTLEAIAALIAGIMAGSVALVGFGVDSLIEVSAAGVAQWRLRADLDADRRERVERISSRIIGGSFLALAAYVAYDGVAALIRREAPERTLFGVIVLSLSVIIMPLLARAKRKVAQQLASRALRAEARQTSLCAYLSMIALAGVILNAGLGWWWADPSAALCMVPIIAKEGLEGFGNH